MISTEIFLLSLGFFITREWFNFQIKISSPWQNSLTESSWKIFFPGLVFSLSCLVAKSQKSYLNCQSHRYKNAVIKKFPEFYKYEMISRDCVTFFLKDHRNSLIFPVDWFLTENVKSNLSSRAEDSVPPVVRKFSPSSADETALSQLSHHKSFNKEPTKVILLHQLRPVCLNPQWNNLIIKRYVFFFRIALNEKFYTFKLVQFQSLQSG